MLDTRRACVGLAAVFALSCATVAFAQDPSKSPQKATARAPRPTATPARGNPFVGVWRLSATKSKYESGGAPRGFTRTYEDRGNGTIFMTTDVDRFTEELAFIVGGKPVENIARITVSVSADGRTMTQVLSAKTGQGRTFTNTLVFDKQ